MKKYRTCSYCGDSGNHLGFMLEHPETQKIICEICAYQMVEVLDMLYQGESKDMSDLCGVLNKPKSIKGKLDDYVIGQDEAKKVLAVAAYNHYKRILNNGFSNGVELQKSNVLLIGQTGSGKTLLAQSLAKIMKVPFAISDATSLTEAGYVGDDVENCLLRLIENAEGDIERAQRGIIFIDEIDKVAKKGENISITRDVSGEGVQQALLKIIEGADVSVPMGGGRKHPGMNNPIINTSNILFIFSGAFVGLENIIKKRSQEKGIGFGAKIEKQNKESLDESLKKVTAQDLIKFGLIPEFIGRIPIIVATESLKESDLVRILTEPKNAIIKQYVELLQMDKIQLTFDEDALNEIAHIAIKREMGARGLRSIAEKIMIDIMFDISDEISTCQITKELILKKFKKKIG